MSSAKQNTTRALCRITGAACIRCRPVCASRLEPETDGQAAGGWRRCPGCWYWRPLSDRSGTGSWTGNRVCHYCLDQKARRPRGADGRCLARTAQPLRRAAHSGIFPRRRKKQAEVSR